MKVIKENHGTAFPMKIECKQTKDDFGFSYGDAVDFCHSILEVEEKDIKKHPWYKYPNYEGIDYGVVCPVCKHFVVIDNDKIPKSVKEKAKEVSISQ